jgi:Fe-S-cluster containining protein
MTDAPPLFTPQTVSERRALQRAFAQKAAACTNVGQTGDERDLYVVFDELQAATKATLPPFACQAGCNECCRLAPSATMVEWQAIHGFLLQMAPNDRRRIVAQAEAQRPLAWAFDMALRHPPTGVQPPLTPEVFCPFLLDGQCSIYAVRPLKCRGYGFAVVASADRRRFYGSPMALNWIKETFPEHIDLAEVILPSFLRYQEFVVAMNDAIGGDRAHLVQWLWAHIAKGEIVAGRHRYEPGRDPEPAD